MNENLIKQFKALHKTEFWDFTEEELLITHPIYNYERHFDSPFNEIEIIEEVTKYLNSRYESGRYIYYENYFEALIHSVNAEPYYFEHDLELLLRDGTDLAKPYYEIGSLSESFATLLENDLPSEMFSAEHYQSIKIRNIKFDVDEKDKQVQIEKYIADCFYLSNSAFFDLSRKTGVFLSLLDLSDIDYFDPDFEEPDFNEIKSTELKLNKYDPDLLMYFNRATEMIDSEFKYIAYFQVLECIFDEVYLYETIQDAKSIIDSSWFHADNFDHVNKLIKVIDRYNKEQNDKSKIKLVLDRFFKMNMHDDAYMLANEEIVDGLIEIKLIKQDTEFKDLQKLASIIYEIRNEYTHSNRAFPKKKEHEVSKSQLKVHIKIIRAIAQTIILNYKRQ